MSAGYSIIRPRIWGVGYQDDLASFSLTAEFVVPPRVLGCRVMRICGCDLEQYRLYAVDFVLVTLSGFHYCPGHGAGAIIYEAWSRERRSGRAPMSGLLARACRFPAAKRCVMRMRLATSFNTGLPGEKSWTHLTTPDTKWSGVPSHMTAQRSRLL